MADIVLDPVLSPIKTSNLSPSKTYLPSPELSPISRQSNAHPSADPPLETVSYSRSTPGVATGIQRTMSGYPVDEPNALVPMLEALKYGTKQMALHKVDMLGKHLVKLSQDGTSFGPATLHKAIEMMKMPKISSQHSKILFKSLLDPTGTGAVNIQDFVQMFGLALRRYKAAQEKQFSSAQTQAQRRTRTKNKAQGYKNDMPTEQMYGMVVERLKALIMSNSIDIIRKFWNEADRQRHGLIGVDQMCALLAECNVPHDKEDLKSVIAQYSSGKSRISFEDFICNLLGFPHDFFASSVDQGRQNLKRPKGTVVAKDKVRICQSSGELMERFRLGLRKKLLNPDVALSKVFNKTRSQTTVTAEQLWTMLHTQKMGASQSEIRQIMNRFDYDKDGKINYQEFVHELLDIPLPKSLKQKLRAAVATKHTAPPLEGRPEIMLRSLRDQVKCSSIQNRTLMEFFNKYDMDGSGRIAYDELKMMLDDLRISSEGDAASTLLSMFDKSGAGTISYADFVQSALQLSDDTLSKINTTAETRGSVAALRDQISKGIISKVTSSPAAHKKVFDFFDRGQAGTCTFGEFSKGIRALDLPLTTEQVRLMWSNFDRDMLDEVNHKAFAKGMQLDGSHQLRPPPSSACYTYPLPSASQSRRTSMRSVSVADVYSQQPSERSSCRSSYKINSGVRSRCSSVASRAQGTPKHATLTLPPIKDLNPFIGSDRIVQK